MSLLTLDAQRALLSLAEHVFIWLLPLRKFEVFCTNGQEGNEQNILAVMAGIKATTKIPE